MIGTWFSSPTVWENQRLPPNAVRSGLPNPQHLGTISCFLKQVLRACLKSHFGQSYLHGNRVFSSKLGFFRNPERPTLFKRILSLYSANRVRSMIGTWFSSPTVWENQRLPPNAVRSGLPNPQHLGTISCFLKQVLRTCFKNPN